MCVDFDDDGKLSLEDMIKVVETITGGGLTDEETTRAAQRCMDELDLDGVGIVNLSEFEHAVSRSDEFLQTFRFSLQ